MIKDLALENQIRKRFGNKFKVTAGSDNLSYMVCCPFCLQRIGKTDKKYKLYITPNKGIYHCFRCSKAGLISELIKEFKSVNPAPVQQAVTALSNNDTSPGQLIPVSNLFDDHLAIRYLQTRDFDPAYLGKHYNVQYCPQGFLFGNIFDTTNTLVFPIVMNGITVGWQARLLYDPSALSEDQYPLYNFTKDEDGEYIIPPKYFTAPGLDKSRILFNYDNARKFNHVVICEGVFDAIKVGLNAVATLGKGVSPLQIKLLKSYWKFAIILLDPGDADGEMLKLEHDLRLSIPTVTIQLKNYKDAGEAPVAEIWNQITNTMKERELNLNLLSE